MRGSRKTFMANDSNTMSPLEAQLCAIEEDDSLWEMQKSILKGLARQHDRMKQGYQRGYDQALIDIQKNYPHLTIKLNP